MTTQLLRFTRCRRVAMIGASLSLAAAQGTAHAQLSQTLAQGRQLYDGAFGSLGPFSVGNLLAVAVLSFTLSALFAMLLAGMRGHLSRPMRMRILRDHAVAAGCSLLLLTAPFALYLLYRSYWRAFDDHVEG